MRTISVTLVLGILACQGCGPTSSSNRPNQRLSPSQGKPLSVQVEGRAEGTTLILDLCISNVGARALRVSVYDPGRQYRFVFARNGELIQTPSNFVLFLNPVDPEEVLQPGGTTSLSANYQDLKTGHYDVTGLLSLEVRDDSPASSAERVVLGVPVISVEITGSDK